MIALSDMPRKRLPREFLGNWAWKWLAFCLASWLSFPAAKAQDSPFSASIITVRIEDRTLIATDPSRDALQVAATVQFNRKGGEEKTGIYRVDIELFDDANQPVLLGPDPGTPIASSQVEEVTIPPGEESVTKVFNGRLIPTAPLSLEHTYWLRAKLLLLNPDDHTILSSEAGYLGLFDYTFWHFASSDPDDQSWNILLQAKAFESETTQAQLWQNNQPERFPFKNAIEVTLRRADAWNRTDEEAEALTVQTRVRVTLRLVNTTTDEEVPLTADSGGEAIFSLAPFQPATETTSRQPAEVTGVIPCTFAPESLEAISPLYLYRLEATVEHTNDDAGTFVTDQQVVYEDVQLAVISGKLFFGEVEAELEPVDVNWLTFSTTATPEGEIPAIMRLEPGVARLVYAPDRFFPSTVQNIDIQLRVNGDLYLVTGSVLSPEEDSVQQNGVTVSRNSIALTPQGAHIIQAIIQLPAGMGYAFEEENGRLQAVYEKTEVRLNAHLEIWEPLQIENPRGGPLYLVHERLPYRLLVDRIEWKPDAGRFVSHVGGTRYVRETELKALEDIDPALLKDPSEADRPSNEKYFRFASVTGSSEGPGIIVIRADDKGRALLDVDLTFSAVDYQTHFPLGVRVKADSGQLALRDGMVDLASSWLAGAEPITFYFSRGVMCSGEALQQTPPEFKPDNNEWHFTEDGGLHAAGALATAQDLSFGITGDQKPVHTLLQVSEGRFHIPGHILSGRVLEEELPDEYAVHRPAVLLLSGHGVRVERPLTPEYEEGLADYAGFNIDATKGMMALSHIAGKEIDSYALKPHSKYYFRPSGVSGVHDAVTSDIMPLPPFYGYDMTLDGLRLSYLDNNNIDSAIGGEITLPYPSGFSIKLAELKLDAYGEFLGGRLVNPQTERLAYWQMPFTPMSADFAKPLGANGCPVAGTAFLTLHVKASLPAITDASLYGRLGFKPDGDLLARADAPGSEVDSRLVLPATLTIKALNGGSYRFTPVTGAALNRYNTADRPADGFVSVAGLLDVPFFEDVKVHLHASSSGDATGDSRLYVMGGWSNSPQFEANHNFGWTENGRNFFNDANFDELNRGWPTGIPLETYRNNKDANGKLLEKYHPVVGKVWRGVVELNYSVEWDTARRVFTGFANPKVNLLVLEAHHELRTLSTTGCSITFGAELSTPRLNVSDLMAERLIAEAERSISRALKNVFSLTVDEMAAGIDGLEKVVSDRLSRLMDEALQEVLDRADGITDKLYENLKTFYETGSIESRIGRLATLSLSGQELNPGGNLEIIQRLEELANAGSPVLAALKQNLERALEVCDSALEVVSPQRRDKVRQAVLQLAAWGGLNAGELSQLDQAMAEADSALRDSEAFLKRVRNTLQQLIAQIDQGGALISELKRALSDAAAQAEAEVLARLRKVFAEEHDLTGRYFEEIPAAKVKERISRVLREVLCAGKLAERVQPVLRARFNDVRDRFRSGLDMVFGQINSVLVSAVRGSVRKGAEAFTELIDGNGQDDADPSANTGVGDFFAVARVEGYAQINGEKIQEMRLNASLRLKASDALVVDGWFRLLNCDSDTPNTSCRDPGVVSTEVTVGAHGEATFGVIPVDVTLEGKFSFGPSGSLTGLDGSFDLRTKLVIRQVSLDRVAFKFGFGGGEGYLSGRVGATVDFVQMEGFCFFGTTKNSRSLDLLDEDTRTLVKFGTLGNVSPAGCFERAIAGFYLGFEGSISINAFFRIPDTCFLRLNALAGAGNFCFLHKDPLDGKLILTAGVRYAYGVRGEILCLVDITGKLGTAIAASLPIGDPTTLLKPDAFIGSLKNAEASGTANLRLSGKVGPCPFCVSFSKTFTLLVRMSRQGGVDVEFD